MIPLSLLALCFLISLLLCAAATRLPAQFYNSTHMMNDLAARQALHHQPTPRIGGAAVILALAGVGALMSDQLGKDLIYALLAGAIVFLVGLREDLSRDVSPRLRLLAAFFAAGAAVWLSGEIVPGLGLGPADVVFQWTMLAVLLTLLWSAGSCHALNLIDGLNGLAGFYTICAASGFWLIAGQTGDTDIQIVSGLLIAAMLGFLVLNWPLGRIFLGDAGAYAIGHVLAWLGILLMARNPEVAGAALLLVMFWPVGDTTYSMIRRRIQRQATGQPDKMHFHHLVVRALPFLFNRKRRMAGDNSLATLVMVPLFATPVVLGVAVWDRGGIALLLLVLLTALFIVTYLKALSYLSRRRYRHSNGVSMTDKRRAVPTSPAE